MSTVARWASTILGILLLIALVSLPWIRLNISPSVPVGLYRLTTLPSIITRGMLVVVPVPRSIQGIWPRLVPLLKPVAGIAGDEVCIRDGIFWIASMNYGSMDTDSTASDVPHLSGCWIIQPGTVILASHAPGSLDGRVFGPTAIADLTAEARPLWTW